MRRLRLFYLAAMAAQDPDALMRYDVVLPASRVGLELGLSFEAVTAVIE